MTGPEPASAAPEAEDYCSCGTAECWCEPDESPVPVGGLPAAPTEDDAVRLFLAAVSDLDGMCSEEGRHNAKRDILVYAPVVAARLVAAEARAEKAEQRFANQMIAATELIDHLSSANDDLTETQAELDAARARVAAVEAQRDDALVLLADAIPDPKGAIDSPQWHRRMDRLAASLDDGTAREFNDCRSTSHDLGTAVAAASPPEDRPADYCCGHPSMCDYGGCAASPPLLEED